MSKVNLFIFVLLCGMGVRCVVALDDSQALSPEDPFERLAPIEVHFPDISPEEETFLEHCVVKTTEICDEQLIFAIFANGRLPPNCCSELRMMGKQCDLHFIKYILSIPEIQSRANKKAVLAQAENVWNNCDIWNH